MFVTIVMQMNNAFGDAGAVRLGAALKSNTSLRRLNLVSCSATVLCVETLLSVTLGMQSMNETTAVGICRIIACILHNVELSDVHFNLQPSDCIHHEAWLREDLAVPPENVARQGWSAVLEYLRQVEQEKGLYPVFFVICAQLQNISRSIPHPLCSSALSYLLCCMPLLLAPSSAPAAHARIICCRLRN